jgi:hypothetical protein
MGYPMTYARVVGRNGLNGPGYNHTTSEPLTPAQATERQVKSMIRGDMRRLEQDSRDEHHLKLYAEHAGITVEQAKMLPLPT